VDGFDEGDDRLDGRFGENAVTEVEDVTRATSSRV
jgi:hypothetical protein